MYAKYQIDLRNTVRQVDFIVRALYTTNPMMKNERSSNIIFFLTKYFFSALNLILSLLQLVCNVHAESQLARRDDMTSSHNTYCYDTEQADEIPTKFYGFISCT